MNLAERRASTTASSAKGVVRKHGKGEGSPCPRGKSGLGSSLLTLPHIFIKSPRIDVFDCGFSFPIPQKFHLFSPFSSIFLLQLASALRWVYLWLCFVLWWYLYYIRIMSFCFQALSFILYFSLLHSPQKIHMVGGIYKL